MPDDTRAVLDAVRKRTESMEAKQSDIDKDLDSVEHRWAQEQDQLAYDLTMLQTQLKSITAELVLTREAFAGVINQLQRTARNQEVTRITSTVESWNPEFKASRTWIEQRTRQLLDEQRQR
ncbi:hypothetical protein COY28_02875 [Candidatus Woesearchaeota archaeon CG_4_10_14_0_2_um_filter_57_5]|nr:MAG: hypothetical protein AUJ68_03630 [Candidatus Woesearchaeota archaeon CG1_02_57_44]PIN68490.1 MAG: hypothetical protein COV94_04360 [Candidatus Woesearchaeota archaeon CG11_big_fil_rev_8_21_14_0_20_57_5]PIZ54135.1 MAG: hypothetical protein COY28_02875 [Candidatus Woesearchaeota archaeon CG_4_10_14_0_2_um_filter_57_5]